MTKSEFYKQYVKPYLTNDRGANNFLFASQIDNLHREGLITDKQAQNWNQPETLTNAFYTKQEKELKK